MDSDPHHHRSCWLRICVPGSQPLVDSQGTIDEVAGGEVVVAGRQSALDTADRKCRWTGGAGGNRGSGATRCTCNAAGAQCLTVLEAANRRREGGIGIAVITRSIVPCHCQMGLGDGQLTSDEIPYREVVVVAD